MICCHCKKVDATKRYERVKADGTKQVENYCMNCYQRLFISSDIGISSRKSGQIAMCPFCGTTEEDFRRVGLIGCAECYHSLSATVLPAVVKLQGDDAHCGKKPMMTGEREEAIRRRNLLKKREEELMKAGNFGAANICHEELKRLNERLYKEGL